MSGISGHQRQIKILQPSLSTSTSRLLNGQRHRVPLDEKPFPSFLRTFQELSTNYWIPDEVDMKDDAKEYHDLPAKERYAFDAIIGLLATLDSPQTRLIYNISDYVTEHAAHVNASMIAQQEAIHNESYSYVLSSITGLADQKRVFELARTHPTIVARNAPIMAAYDEFLSEKTPDTLVKALLQSSILEGINFYSGFAFFYNLVRQNRMTGTGKIISFINRDELAHTKFITELVRAILGEQRHLNTDALADYAREAFRHAVDLETQWSSEVLTDIDGIDVQEMLTYVKYRANKMAGMLGIEPLYDEATDNGMPWIRAYADNFTEIKTDFFEQRNASYKKTNGQNDFDSL
ncbi:ribonucleotide-diphosphate reductase subunit beta [Zymobacter palmae]|nr:ribonucleotide-diphosphate reductase subunit beta [Zymobacter palmae]BBG30245.1 ribonucleotide reductase, beta subunit [Zymobacter palmae]